MLRSRKTSFRERSAAAFERPERRATAQLILATLEGGLVLARARGAKEPLLESGGSLATMLDGRFPARRRARRP